MCGHEKKLPKKAIVSVKNSKETFCQTEGIPISIHNTSAFNISVQRDPNFFGVGFMKIFNIVWNVIRMWVWW